MTASRGKIIAVSLKKFFKQQPMILLFIVFTIVISIARPNFTSLQNMNNILIDASIYGVSALAMTIAIICGEFDLSLAANFAWAQIFFCFLLNRWGATPLGLAASLLVMLLSCISIGIVNGLVVVKGKINSFIATMGMLTIVRGICLVFTGGNMISTTNQFIISMGKGRIWGISNLSYMFAGIAFIAFFVMRYTRFGRSLYATGGNYATAKIAGMRVQFNKFIIFPILGLAAGISGVMFVCLMRAGSVLYGTDLSLTCVAATVIGGTPLTGGKGNVLKTVVGVLLIYVIYKALAFLGLQGYYNTMIRGLILLIVVFVDAYMTNVGGGRR
jgi:ribose transport system permease protein